MTDRETGRSSNYYENRLSVHDISGQDVTVFLCNQLQTPESVQNLFQESGNSEILASVVIHGQHSTMSHEVYFSSARRHYEVFEALVEEGKFDETKDKLLNLQIRKLGKMIHHIQFSNAQLNERTKMVSYLDFLGNPLGEIGEFDKVFPNTIESLLRVLPNESIFPKLNIGWRNTNDIATYNIDTTEFRVKPGRR